MAKGSWLPVLRKEKANHLIQQVFLYDYYQLPFFQLDLPQSAFLI